MRWRSCALPYGKLGSSAPGAYRLKVAMVKPEEPALRVALGIAGRDAEGRYDLCEVTAKPDDTPERAAYEEGFETGVAGWAPTPGMQARPDALAHTGKGSLLVSGTQPGDAWNYVGVTLPCAVLPGSRYRISCWMHVEVCDGKRAPYLKLGIADAAGKWITNFSTGPYDTGKLGTWQYLEGYAETTPDTAGGHMAIEKGGLEAKITATIRLDDVKVELVEAP